MPEDTRILKNVNTLVILRKMWTPEDLIVRKKFCGLNHINTTLDKIRRQAGADYAVLVVIKNEAIYKSLLMVAGDSRIGASQKRVAILAQYKNLKNKKITQKKIENLVGFGLKEGDEEERDSKLNAARKNKKDGPTVWLLVKSQIKNTHSVSESKNNRMESLHAPIQNDLFNTLYLQVCGSAAVNKHQDQENRKKVKKFLFELEQGVDAQISWKLPLGRIGEFVEKKEQDLSRKLLEFSCEINRSDGGVVYLKTETPGTLKLASVSGELVFPKRLECLSPESWLEKIVSTSKPWSLDKKEFLEVFGKNASKLKFPDSVLVIPFFGKGEKLSLDSLFGVVVLYRSKRRSGFTHMDLDRMENIWDGFHFLRYKIGYYFCQSGYMSTVSEANRRDSQSILRQISNSRELMKGVPPEVILENENIKKALLLALKLTSSFTATFRIISQNSESLYRLHRIPEDPNPLEGDENGTREIKIPIFKKKQQITSINSWVALNGKACVIGNVRSKKMYENYTELTGSIKIKNRGTVSESCYPIFVLGRLYGVINIESRFKMGHLGCEDFFTSLTELIGIMIAVSRQHIEETVKKFFGETWHAAHRLLNLADEYDSLTKRLSPLIGGEDSNGVQSMIELNERLKSIGGLLKVNPISESENERSQDQKASLFKLIEDLIDYEKLRSLVYLGRDFEKNREYEWIELAVAERVWYALREVISNAVIRTSGSELVRVTYSSFKKAGIPHAHIRIINKIVGDVDEDVLNFLYQIPLVKTDRTHIGAFSAGVAMREIGGNVFAVFDKNTQNFSSFIEIPMREE